MILSCTECRTLLTPRARACVPRLFGVPPRTRRVLCCACSLSASPVPPQLGPFTRVLLPLQTVVPGGSLLVDGGRRVPSGCPVLLTFRDQGPRSRLTIAMVWTDSRGGGSVPWSLLPLLLPEKGLVSRFSFRNPREGPSLCHVLTLPAGTVTGGPHPIL